LERASASRLLRHAARFTDELGVETIHDLTELLEADFAQLGLESAWPRFRAELSRLVGKRRYDRFQLRRKESTDRILAAGNNASVANFLEAAGASKFAPRLSALGVETAANLRSLYLADVKELGMLALHARRFRAAVQLAPAVDDAAIADAAMAMVGSGGGQAGGTLSCSALLIPMRLGHLCAPLALALSAGAAAAVARPALAASSPAAYPPLPLKSLCRARALDLEAAGCRLVQRRRLWTALRAIAPRLCGALAPTAPTPPAEPAAFELPSLPPLPPLPASGDASTRFDAHTLDGCRHVFLDVGANVGINHHHLYRYWHGAMQPLFDEYFGHTKASRRGGVCSVGIEANPHHTAALAQVRQLHWSRGMRVYFQTETAAGARPSTVTFNLQNESKLGRSVHEWGASIYKSSVLSGESAKATVPVIDLARFVREVVLSRTIPPPPPSMASLSLLDAKGLGEAGGTALATPSVVMKMDIEGSEFETLSRLLSSGVLCSLDAAAIEWHDERYGTKAPPTLVLLDAVLTCALSQSPPV